MIICRPAAGCGGDGPLNCRADGVSVAHAAGDLDRHDEPEEGELRPQLLDRFGLTVEITAPRDPELRAEVVRRRMAFDRDPASFVAAYAADEQTLRIRIATARALLPSVHLDDQKLATIARVCAAFDVDGMRADIVTARAAAAHAAWHGRRDITTSDIRAAARLALPHRRRRNPFDAPGLDEDLLINFSMGTRSEPPPPDGSPPGAPRPIRARHRQPSVPMAIRETQNAGTPSSSPSTATRQGHRQRQEPPRGSSRPATLPHAVLFTASGSASARRAAAAAPSPRPGVQSGRSRPIATAAGCTSQQPSARPRRTR